MKNLLRHVLVVGLLSFLNVSAPCLLHATTPTGTLFTENKGQLADQKGNSREDVLFSTSQHGVQLFIGKSALHYQWRKTEAPDVGACESNTDSLLKQKSISYRVDINLLNGLNPTAVIPENPAEAYNNYYLPQCPNGITHVQSYEKFTVKNIYHNIDWTFYTRDGKLEYDFIVQPGGNPADIAMQIDGAAEVALSAEGNLIITTPLGTCEQAAPVVTQNGKKLDSKFILQGNILRFSVAGYNPVLALNIDPVIKMWGTYYGGTGNEISTDLATDKSGFVYMAGYTSSTNSISSGGFQTSYGAGAYDGFLVKMNAAGSRVWSTYYGGDSTDMVYGCSTDTLGNVFISGTTWSSNVIAFNGFKNSINVSPGTDYGSDAFLVKFNSSGARQWGTYLGEISSSYTTGTWKYEEKSDQGFKCATDLSGNIYISGYTMPMYKVCYDPNGNIVPCQNTYLGTAGAYQDTTGGVPVGGYGYLNPFVVKFSGTGSRLWGTYYGGTGSFFSTPNLITCATDRAGNVYLAGTTGSDYTGPSLGYLGHQNTPGSTTDAWLVKFNPTGTTRLWSTYYGGYADENLSGLCTDSTGNVFITGNTLSSNSGNVIATNGAFRTGLIGSSADPFLVKFNSTGSRQWGTYMGDVGQDAGGECVADNNGKVITTFRGSFVSGDAGWVAYCGSTRGPTYGVAITRFTATGQREWGEAYTGNTGSSQNYVSCAVSPNGKLIYLSDYYDTYNANVPANAYQGTITGGSDAFLVCFRDTAVYDTICGYVWDDTNGNGVQEIGEGFLNNVEVYMSVPQGQQTYRAYSNASGYYQLQVPKWGTAGLCNTPLYVQAPLGKVVSMPVSSSYPSYPASILGNSPLCNYNFGISPAIHITGNIYYDTNRNSQLTSGEPGIVWQSVSFNAQRQAYTGPNGDYSIFIPVGTYTETFDKLDAYATSTSSPASYSIAGTTPGATFNNKDFGAYFTPSFINSNAYIWQRGIPPVVGQTCTWTASSYNLGTLPTRDTVVFHYDPQLVYTGSIVGVTHNASAHILTGITGNTVPARGAEYSFTFQVPVTVPVGTILHNWVEVSPASQPDIDLTNNRDDDYSIVLASYDPNNKIAETNTANPAQHIARNWSTGDDFIRYVINFQNTGSYTAFNVVLNDTLPAQIDASTLRFIKSSHTCDIARSGNVINFKFSSINLPDSASNEPSSKGYVVFMVKPATTALAGDSIVNRAAIYFDYNSPVITEKSVINLIAIGPCTRLVEKDIYDTVCALRNYVFDGDTIRAAGLYVSDTIVTAYGCDSVTRLHLTVTGTITHVHKYASFCSSAGYIFNGDTLYSGGLFYSDTVYPPGQCGMDTVLHLTYTINTYITRDTLSPCGDFYYYSKGIILSPGVYYDTTVNNQGCLTINTIIVSPRITGIKEYLCSGDSILFNGIWRKASGVYYDTLQASCHGDSIVQLRLTVSGNSVVASKTVYKCSGRSYYFNGTNITAPGSYTQTLANASSCGTDSITNLTLYNYQGAQTNSNYLHVYINSGETFYYHGTGYTQSGQHQVTIPGAAVCGLDSVQYLWVHVNSTTSLSLDFDSVVAPNCATNTNGYIRVKPRGGVGPYTYSWSTGDTTNYIADMGGWYGITITDFNNRTASYNTLWYFDTVFTTTHDPSFVCHSGDTGSVTIHLNLYPHNTRYPYKMLFERANNVYDTIIIPYPQTSVTVNNLPVGLHQYITSDATGCREQGSAIFYGNIARIDTVGFFVRDTLVAPSTCSSATLQLEVSNIKVTNYGNGSYGFSYHYGRPPYVVDYENNGLHYSDTLWQIYNVQNLSLSAGAHDIIITESTNGCTKTITENIPGFANTITNVALDACGAQHQLTVTSLGGTLPYGYSWSNGATTNSITTGAGNYTLIATEASGCADTIQIQVSTTQLTSTQQQAICSSDSILFNNNYLSAPGTYNDTLISASGCDSIVILTLQVNTAPSPAVTQNGGILSTGTYSAYKWYLDNVAINGASAQSFTPLQSGNYKVEVTDANGCKNQSPLFNVIISGILENAQAYHVWLYPNPTSGMLQLKFSDGVQREILITNTLAQTVMQREAVQESRQLNLSYLPEGIYYMHIKDATGLRTLRFVLAR